jgi:DNA helicase-2/ATP-dependent DNA helicase PcrA
MIVTSSINYMAALNDRQKKAVEHRDGPLLVIAGAGSGKTRTLTYRVARLVEDQISPHSILLLTFTRKAATEMLNRASELLDQRCGEISGGTFHAFSNLLLKKYAKYAGVDPAFSILDRADMHHLITMAKKNLGITKQARSFPKSQTLAQIFSMSVNKESPIEAVIENHFAHLATFTEILHALFTEYTRHKIRHHFLDYDDLLLYAKRLLTAHPDIRTRVSSTYRYVMVDEYQDTNRIQADLLYLLAESHQNVMAVGDDSQSIYAFRGAEIQNILEFPKRFKNTRILRLEENYRSVQPVLSMANAILEKAVHRYPKRLFTNKKKGNTPCLIRAENENTQSRFVVEKLRHLMGNGIPLDQIAVLFRSGFHSFDLEIELKRNSIPFVKVGGFQFAESAHIKDFLAHLKVLTNPYDKLSWLRILMLLNHVGTKTAEKIYNTFVARDAGLSGFLSMDGPHFSHGGIQALQEFFKALLAENDDPGKIGEWLMRYYLPLLRENYEDHPKRAKELEQVVGIMDRYAALEAFLADMALEPPNTSTGAELYLPEAGNARLTLSTIHSAKGLEWHTVFIIYTLEGRFPSFQSILDPPALEEELRLMYVAATRAKENLFFVYPQEVFDRSSGMILNRPSSFLGEIEKTTLKKQVARTRPDVKASLRTGTGHRFYNRRL